MESPYDLSEGSPPVPDIRILQVFEDNENTHRLIIDGQDRGIIDWEESPDGKQAYIDGLDAEHEITSLPNPDLAWLVISSCMHVYHPEVRRIEHMFGVIELTEE